jgi:hypothetical protein
VSISLSLVRVDPELEENAKDSFAGQLQRQAAETSEDSERGRSESPLRPVAGPLPVPASAAREPLEARFVLSLAADGSVIAAEPLEGDPDDPRLAALGRAVARWRFAAPEGGDPVLPARVVVAITLTPAAP